MYSVIFWKSERPKAKFVVGRTVKESSLKMYSIKNWKIRKGRGHFCRRSDYHRISVGRSKNKKCTQSNIEKSGRARGIFVVGQNLAKTCTQIIIENRKGERPILLSWNPEKAPAYPQEKPHKCTQCDYASSKAGHLRDHMKTHPL